MLACFPVGEELLPWPTAGDRGPGIFLIYYWLGCLGINDHRLQVFTHSLDKIIEVIDHTLPYDFDFIGCK